MITEEEARSIVQSHIETFPPLEDDRYIILDESTIAKEWGWVFFYTSEKWLLTGELQYAVAGNAPFIVEREAGNIQLKGTEGLNFDLSL